jgi:hypothetical protein
MEWSFCADLTVLSAAPPEVTEELKMKYVGPVPKTTALLHAGVHWTVGSVGRNTSGARGRWGKWQAVRLPACLPARPPACLPASQPIV